jgi:hypothetical protein
MIERTIYKWLIGYFQHPRVPVRGDSEHLAFYQHDDI